MQPGVTGVWQAFQRLQGDRPWHGGGFGPAAPGGIPFTAVDRYARRHGFDGDDFAWLDTLLSEMDAEYIAWFGERQDKPDDRQPSGVPVPD